MNNSKGLSVKIAEPRTQPRSSRNANSNQESKNPTQKNLANEDVAKNEGVTQHLSEVDRECYSIRVGDLEEKLQRQTELYLSLFYFYFYLRYTCNYSL